MTRGTLRSDGLYARRRGVGDIRAQTNGDQRRLSTVRRAARAAMSSRHTHGQSPFVVSDICQNSLATLFDSLSRSIVPSHVCANGANMSPPSARQRCTAATLLSPLAERPRRPSPTSHVVSRNVRHGWDQLDPNIRQSTHVVLLHLVIFIYPCKRPPLYPKLRNTVPNDIQAPTRDHLCPDRPLPQGDEVPPP